MPPASPNSALICWSKARAPRPVSAIGTLTKTNSSSSCEDRSCSSPTPAIPSSKLAIARASKAGSVMAITLQNRGGGDRIDS